jgi:hypothetical protein
LLSFNDSIFNSFDALPLRRTSWYYHSYHSLLGFSCSHFPGIVNRSLLVVVIPLSWHLFTWSMLITTTTDYLLIHSSGPCGICTTTPRLVFTWLVVHSIGIPRTLDDSHVASLSIPIGLHGLFIDLFFFRET